MIYTHDNDDVMVNHGENRPVKHEMHFCVLPFAEKSRS